MTLVVTAATANFVAQVSDKRLTLPDGSPFDDEANKAVVLSCEDGDLAIAYTGLAYVGELQADGLGKFRTDDWLVEVLTKRRAGRMLASRVIAMLTEEATKEFAEMPVSPENKRASFYVGGWPNAAGLEPALWLISNFEFLAAPMPVLRWRGWHRGRCLPAAKDAFGVALVRPRKWTRKTCLIVVGGRDTAVVHAGKRLKKLKDFLVKAPEPIEVTRRLVNFVRQCADHEEEGKYIGRNCEAVFISRRHRAFSYYGEESSTPVAFGPHFVGPGATFKDIVVREATGEEDNDD